MESAQLQRLLDKDAIRGVIERMGALFDASVFKALTEVFTDDVVVEGWSERWEGAPTAIKRLAEINADHHGSHRMITNHRVDLGSDRATAIAHYRSSHLEAQPEAGSYGHTHAHEGWYVTQLVRAADGWRIRHLRHVSLASTVGSTDEAREALRLVSSI